MGAARRRAAALPRSAPAAQGARRARAARAPFLRGGIWQGFLAKYPEANFMHKKMVLGLGQARSAPRRSSAPASSGALDHARRELYRAQCNCCYWHGLFGGLYLNYLRDAVYRHLIEAEVARRARARRRREPRRATVRDLDADLQPEVVLQNARGRGRIVKPDLGGGVFELDYRPKRFNLLNVLGRRAEGYHGACSTRRARARSAGDGPVSIHDLIAVKSAGLEDLLIYDRHPRLALRRPLPRRRHHARRAWRAGSYDERRRLRRRAPTSIVDQTPARRARACSCAARPRRRARASPSKRRSRSRARG